jgi:hypothetical protein
LHIFADHEIEGIDLFDMNDHQASVTDGKIIFFITFLESYFDSCIIGSFEIRSFRFDSIIFKNILYIALSDTPFFKIKSSYVEEFGHVKLDANPNGC